MKLWEFVKELSFFFPLNGTDEHKNKIFDSYVENLEGICISNKCDYDWKKVLQTIQRTYAYSKFPPLADIIKCLPEGKIFKPYIPCENEGDLIVVRFPDGRINAFEASGIGKISVNDIQEKHKGCIVERYPKGSVLIGKKVFIGGE